MALSKLQNKSVQYITAKTLIYYEADQMWYNSYKIYDLSLITLSMISYSLSHGIEIWLQIRLHSLPFS